METKKISIEPVAYGLFMLVDGEYWLQFPVGATKEEVASDLEMYAKDDRVMSKILALYSAAQVATLQARIAELEGKK